MEEYYYLTEYFMTAGSVMVNAPVCKTGTRRVNIAGSNPALPT